MTNYSPNPNSLYASRQRRSSRFYHLKAAQRKPDNAKEGRKDGWQTRVGSTKSELKIALLAETTLLCRPLSLSFGFLIFMRRVISIYEALILSLLFFFFFLLGITDCETMQLLLFPYFLTPYEATFDYYFRLSLFFVFGAGESKIEASSGSWLYHHSLLREK